MSSKKVEASVWKNDEWNVVRGRLKRTQGNPGKISHLFKYVGEKLPFEALSSVYNELKKHGVKCEGVYMAHDSMGVARYGGRGQIFSRLAAHKRNYPSVLLYFSFYIIETKKHEHEIETVILRAAGPQMILNERKVGDGIYPGSVSDYEGGSQFFERQHKRGKRKSRRKRSK